MTVSQLNGVWRYRFQIKGKRYFASLPHCKTKTQARAAEDEAKTKARRGELQALAARTTFSDFVKDEFLPWSKANHCPRWHEVLGYLLKAFEPFFGTRTLGEISPFLVEKFKAERLKTPTKRGTSRTAATMNQELVALSSIFALAVKAEIIKSNPVAQVALLTVDNRRERVLEPAEEERLLAVLRPLHGVVDNYFLPLVVLAIHTGLRQSELLGLRWAEVDLQRGEIRRATSKNKRRRRVQLNATARAALAELGNGAGASEYVFLNPATGTHRLHVKHKWARACREAGITGLRWHDLRHTFASRLVEAGAHQVEIRELLGHSSTSMTFRYTHASNERLTQVVESIAERKRA